VNARESLNMRSAAPRTSRVAAVISGPIPSPSMTTIDTGAAAAVALIAARVLSRLGRTMIRLSPLVPSPPAGEGNSNGSTQKKG
jgi:hypothetical protein